MTARKKSYAEVAVAIPVFKTLTYEVPEVFHSVVMPGKRVLVPVRNSKVTGYILGCFDNADQANIKEIIDIIDDEPLFPPSMVEFFRWIATYYLHPIGEVIKAALPGGLNARQGRVRPKKALYVRTTDKKPRISALSKTSDNLLNIVNTHGEISLQALKKEIPSAGRLAKKMNEAGFLELVERNVYRDPFGEAIEPQPTPYVLTKEQALVVETIIDVLGKGFQTYLLYGITGSGKTEVYMQAVAKALEKGYQALVLVPEIALMSQIERVFRARFGDCVALLHSGLSQGERFDQWMRIVHKKVKIAIGARSAIFAPFEHLGLIIVDEEHDESYKQESKLRYNARDLAVVRAKEQAAVVLLGSATPSVQSYYNVLAGKFRGLRLKKRIEDQVLPKVTVVDLKQTEGRRRAKPFITEELKSAISETLARKEQVLLFLNRRGFANYPTCTACGSPIRCKNCEVTMTLHQEANCFKCHYCGYTTPQAAGCSICGNPKVIPIGLGTEKVEAKVQSLFPEARVARMDRDTTARKGALVKILKDLRTGAIDILIGTQMVAKGHHYPNITLVGILCADLSLNFPDFRSAERTFQLLAQVAGRAGRGKRPGRVILQTFNPEHSCITTARDQDYAGFYKNEIPFRKTAAYPPYWRLVQILITGKDKEKTAQYAGTVGKICRDLLAEHKSFRGAVKFLGPVTAPLARIKKEYRWQLLLKGAKTIPLHKLARLLKAKAQQEIPARGVKIIVDVDPVNML